jgi:exonuclease VII large subunit
MQLRPLLIALALSLTPVVLPAQQAMPEGHAEHHPESAQPPDEAAETQAPDSDTATDQAADEEETPDPMLTYMQQRMEEMISHWDAMSQTTDPAERQKLMQEHRQKMMALNAMIGNMAQQRSMMMGPGRGMMGMGGMMGQSGCPMMKGRGPGMGGMMGKGGCPMMGKGSGRGGAMMGHGMMGQGMMNAGGDADLREALQQLAKRVDLLQQMLEHLLQD